MAIVANALTFHTMLAPAHDVRTLDDLRSGGVLPKAALLKEWDRILEINYWPIFHIAKEIMLPIPPGVAAKLLDRLADVASELQAHGVTQSHDIYGRTFQRLISDRKFLATFYTLPTSAALLAELAVDRFPSEWSVDRWASADAVTKLRVADFACGTGTLLTAAYHAVLSRHRRAGGDDAKAHSSMMAEAMIAADIMPAATHLTASMLSSAHPTVTFENTKVHLLPFGRQRRDRTEFSLRFALGALDLISSEHGTGLFENTGIEVHRGKGKKYATSGVGRFALAHRSIDLVIMNPPFTRPTNHERTAEPVPPFAGLATDAEAQSAMSGLLKSIKKDIENPASHGNAGIASSFLDLAEAKIRKQGVLALVMPLSLLQGESWQASRDLLASRYEGAVVVGLSGTGTYSSSFSADTGMAEVLLVARRRRHRIPMSKVRTLPKKQPAGAVDSVHFVSLRRRPTSSVESVGFAQAIREATMAGTEQFVQVKVGDDVVGTAMTGTWDEGACVSMASPELFDVVRCLQRSFLKLPGVRRMQVLRMARLGELGRRGRVHRDIMGPDGRGPFDIVDIERSPTYPVLWNHDANRERYLLVEPDRQAMVRDSDDRRADNMWRTATRLHFTLDFRLNSQSLAACVTSTKTLGGTAWPNFRMEFRRDELATLLWANTTVGLILFWWEGSAQQQGRARLTISRLPDLWVLDTRRLSDTAHVRASEIYNEFRRRRFLPANEAYRDKTRIALDEAVLIDLLGLPKSLLEPLATLRNRWCSEPTVHGGKSTQPGGPPGTSWSG